MELFKWLSLAFILMLGPMILIHELGHFITARRAGVRVLEFGFGFPPRLLILFREAGTLEVGGVRMLLPGRVPLPRGLAPRQTVEVIADRDPSGALRVRQIRPADGETIWDKTPLALRARGPLTALEEGTIYSLNLLPIGAFVHMGEENPSDPRSLAAQPKRWRLTVILAGAALNILTAFLLMTASYAAGVPTRTFAQIREVIPDTPAQTAGLLPGDIIAAVNGDRLEEGTVELREKVQSSAGAPLELTVLREGATMTITATPVLTDTYERAKDSSPSYYLGVYLQPWPDPASLKYYPLHQAALAAGEKFVIILQTLFNLPRAISTGEATPEAARLTGMPGILSFLGLALKHTVQTGIPFYALQVTALISLALGITNLLPLPALDGGRALFVIIEAIRGRRISPATEAKIHFAGVVILIALSLFLIMQDILNPIIPWSWLNR